MITITKVWSVSLSVILCYGVHPTNWRILHASPSDAGIKVAQMTCLYSYKVHGGLFIWGYLTDLAVGTDNLSQ